LWGQYRSIILQVIIKSTHYISGCYSKREGEKAHADPAVRICGRDQARSARALKKETQRYKEGILRQVKQYNPVVRSRETIHHRHRVDTNENPIGSQRAKKLGISLSRVQGTFNQRGKRISQVSDRQEIRPATSTFKPIDSFCLIQKDNRHPDPEQKEKLQQARDE